MFAVLVEYTMHEIDLDGIQSAMSCAWLIMVGDALITVIALSESIEHDFIITELKYPN